MHIKSKTNKTSKTKQPLNKKSETATKNSMVKTTQTNKQQTIQWVEGIEERSALRLADPEASAPRF